MFSYDINKKNEVKVIAGTTSSILIANNTSYDLTEEIVDENSKGNMLYTFNFRINRGSVVDISKLSIKCMFAIESGIYDLSKIATSIELTQCSEITLHGDGQGFTITTDSIPIISRYFKITISNTQGFDIYLRGVTKNLLNSQVYFPYRKNDEVIATSKNETIKLIDSVEVRDTSSLDKFIDLSKYSNVSFYFISSLDADVDILFRPFGATAKIFDGENFIDLKTTIPQSIANYNVILNTVLPELNSNFSELYIRVNAKTTPTTGVIKLYIVCS